MKTFLSEEENMADLISQMNEQDRGRLSRFEHERIEAAFTGRRFVVYQPTGLTSQGQHRPPKILAGIRVQEFYCDDELGASVVFHDLAEGERMTIGHVPTKLFDYDVFVHIPPMYKLRWDASPDSNGLIRSLVWPVQIYARNRSSFYSAGVTYMETPNKFRELYPDVKFDLSKV